MATRNPSAPATTPANTSTPKGFALTGPSVALDPRVHAVRNDLADIRLAGRVFAPHFAAPLFCRIEHAAALRTTRDGGEMVAELAPGEPFEVLELADDHAWGRSPARALVGYLDRGALERAR